MAFQKYINNVKKIRKISVEDVKEFQKKNYNSQISNLRQLKPLKLNNFRTLAAFCLFFYLLLSQSYCENFSQCSNGCCPNRNFNEKPEIFTYTFPAGSKLISFPFTPVDKSINILKNALQSTTTEFIKLFAYDTATEKYVSPDEPNFPLIQPGTGFWLFLDKETTISVQGTAVSSSPEDVARGFNLANDTQPFTIPLKQGWNLLGNPFSEPLYLLADELQIDGIPISQLPEIKNNI